MAISIDTNIVILHLKEAKKNYRMDICRGNFEMFQNGAIIIDKLFDTIYYFPESISNQKVQEQMKTNSCTIFPSVRKCLCSLNQQKRNIVLADNNCVYATEATDSLVQIFLDISNNYGEIFDFEYDAVKSCLKRKPKSVNGVKDVIRLKQTEKFHTTEDCSNMKRKSRNTRICTRKRMTVPLRKMEKELDNQNYFPHLEEKVVLFTRPIFRTNDKNPPSLMEVVNSNIDPYSLSKEQSSLGDIVADCAGPDSLSLSSTPRLQPSQPTHTRDYPAHNATASNINHTEIRRLEDETSAGSMSDSVHCAEEQNENQQRSPKHPGYSTYEARKASYSTFTQFRNLDTKEMAKSGFFYKGTADEVQCFQCGIVHRNWRPDKDPLLEHIKQSPDCLFLERHLGVNTLNQYKTQIRSSGKISGRESFSSSSTDEGATSGTPVPTLTANDHIRSPQYQAYGERISTFTRWPPSMKQKPEQVAQAGFYYTGLDDVVRCFACDGGLKNWDPEDEPWIEHARWFPQCPFVQKVKGQEFVDLVRRLTEDSDEKNTQNLTLATQRQFCE